MSWRKEVFSDMGIVFVGVRPDVGRQLTEKHRQRQQGMQTVGEIYVKAYRRNQPTK
jgi:hypothetical protein